MFLVGSWVNICFLFCFPAMPASLHWYTLVHLSFRFCIFESGKREFNEIWPFVRAPLWVGGWSGQPQILKSPYPEFSSLLFKTQSKACFSNSIAAIHCFRMYNQQFTPLHHYQFNPQASLPASPWRWGLPDGSHAHQGGPAQPAIGFQRWWW